MTGSSAGGGGVRRRPRIMSSDQTFREQQGHSLILPCHVANLGNFVLMWKKDHRVISAGNLIVRKDARIRLRKDYALEISHLKPEDQGSYICEIDVMGNPISIEHKVDVMVPPVVRVRQGVISTRKGQDITLSCAGKGHPNPRITWSKKGGLLSTDRQSQEGLSLELRNVGRRDAGTYVCTASNGIGKEAHGEIQVDITYPPEIEIEQNWYEREGLVEVELICVVHAKPPAEVSWYRRQKKLHETDRQIFQRKSGRNTLHIRNVNPSDFGNFSCRASNLLGKARTYTALSGNPRPPRFVSDSIGYRPTAYNITWTTDSYSPITEYKIFYRKSDGLPIMESTSGEGEGGHEIELSGGNWQTVVIPVTEALMTTAFSTRTTYTLRGLQAGAVYDVVAKAKNKFGWSDQSKTFNFFNKGVDYSTQQLSANDGPADPFGPSNGGSGGTGVGGGGGGGYEDVMSKGSSEGGYSNPSLYTNSAPRSSSGDLSFITALLVVLILTSSIRRIASCDQDLPSLPYSSVQADTNSSQQQSSNVVRSHQQSTSRASPLLHLSFQEPLLCSSSDSKAASCNKVPTEQIGT